MHRQLFGRGVMALPRPAGFITYGSPGRGEVLEKERTKTERVGKEGGKRRGEKKKRREASPLQ